MKEQFSRTGLLIGEEGIIKLNNSKVSVFGLGGVGSFAVEALARAGVGSLDLIDFDDICPTNINRQLHALHSTIGKSKVEVVKERILDINPEANVRVFKRFYTGEDAELFLGENPDYVVDAIDTVSSKVSLAKECYLRKIPIVCSMGAGNRLNPYGFRAADISLTTGCPLAKAMRKLLKKEGIDRGIKVVFSPETPQKPLYSADDSLPGSAGNEVVMKKQVPGSISFVPSVVGLLLAGEVINDLLAKKY